MRKVDLLTFRCILLMVLVIWTTCNYNFCFAEVPENNSNQTNIAPELRSETVDFSNGTKKFQLNSYWKIQDGELQFVPAKETVSYTFYNRFLDYALSYYTISVKARWIEGSDASYYGLFCKSNNNNYYAFMVTLSSYAILGKITNGKWETIKNRKVNCPSDSAYDLVKISCDGRYIKCFLNERLVYQIEDGGTPDNTSFGICSEGNIQCGFKDFTIQEITKNPTKKSPAMNFL